MGFLDLFRRKPTYRGVTTAAGEPVHIVIAKRQSRPSAEHYLRPENTSQAACVIRAFMTGQPRTAQDIRRILRDDGHMVNDVGHRISDARKAFARAGIMLQGTPVKLKSGKRCHQYHLTGEALEALALLHRRLNCGD